MTFREGDDVLYTAPAEKGGWKTRAVVVGMGGRRVVIEYEMRNEIRMARVSPTQLRLLGGSARRAAS